MKKQAGFTLIEMIIVFAVLVVLAVFFAIQRNDLEIASRDQTRKTAINAFYYDLTEVFYAKNKYYPQTISSENLKAVDPTLFTDPNEVTLNGDKCVYTDANDEQATDGDCEYHYSASDCNNEGKCQAFKLRANMENEADYEKASPTKKK